MEEKTEIWNGRGDGLDSGKRENEGKIYPVLGTQRMLHAVPGE